VATSFLTALSAVPWGTLIERAPGLIEQGSKLLLSMRGKKDGVQVPVTAKAEDLRGIVAAQATEIATLRNDLTQASALIVELSRDQARLIGEVSRLRLWCKGIGAAAGLALIGMVVLAFR